MSDEIKFRTKEELFKRVKPALYSKVTEVRRLGYDFVDEKDVWNYLVDNEWRMRTHLELHDLINDVLNADNYKIKDYVMNRMKGMKKSDSIINDVI